MHCYMPIMGVPGSSAGEESTCNAGDPNLIPGLGRSTERIGYPLQYSWASPVPQMVKNLPAKQKIWVRSLGRENSPGVGNSNPLQYSCLGKSMGSQRARHN